MKESHITLAMILFGTMVSYDVIKAGNTYLYLVRFNETFQIGDLKNIQNVYDLFVKLFFVIGMFLMANILIVGQIRVFTGAVNPTDNKDPESVILFNSVIKNTIQQSIIFFTVYFYWVRHLYQSQKDIHRALLFPTAFFMARLSYLCFYAIGVYIGMTQLRYISFMLSFWLVVILLLEINSIKVIDAYF